MTSRLINLVSKEHNVMSDSLFEVIESEKLPDALFEVVQYQHLRGSDNLGVAETVFFANQANIHAKMVRVTLSNNAIRCANLCANL
jgi:hypothetical protein